VARILKPLRDGRNVCAAYYGHPGILCVSAHEAVQRARQLGFSARMLPAVSAMDSLFADLEIDPCFGLYSYDATDFVFKRRPYDPRYMLILWQIGLVGVHSHQPKDLWSRSGVRRLTETLMETYSADHEVVLYEIQYRPAPEPVIERMPLARLPHAAVTIASLLYVPPK
jgi:uncharacterized protein YabN with tetrapyrrole methylase and pyrophosphatase domain